MAGDPFHAHLDYRDRARALQGRAARRSWAEAYRRFRAAGRGVAQCHQPELRYLEVQCGVVVRVGAPPVPVRLLYSEHSGRGLRRVYRPERSGDFYDLLLAELVDPDYAAYQEPRYAKNWLGRRLAMVKMMRYQRPPSRLPADEPVAPVPASVPRRRGPVAQRRLSA